MAEHWIIDLTKELEHPLPPTDNKLWAKSIYRVPKILTDVNSQAYEPKLASFGPYHHGSRHVRPMEQHKRRALIQFLRRIGRASKSPDDVLVDMKKVESRLRFSYDSLQTGDDVNDVPDRGHQCHHDWTEDEFLKLMITDGCFSLEFMLAVKRDATKEQSEYDSHDPVLDADRMNYIKPNMKQDMLLIENQLPLLALYTLADMEGSMITTVVGTGRLAPDRPFPAATSRGHGFRPQGASTPDRPFPVATSRGRGLRPHRAARPAAPFPRPLPAVAGSARMGRRARPPVPRGRLPRSRAPFARGGAPGCPFPVGGRGLRPQGAARLAAPFSQPPPTATDFGGKGRGAQPPLSCI